MGIVAKEWVLNLTRKIKEEKGKMGVGLAVVFFFFTSQTPLGICDINKIS